MSPESGLDRRERDRQAGSSRWQRRRYGVNVSRVLRLTHLGGDENALWLTVNEGPAMHTTGRHGIPYQRKDATTSTWFKEDYVNIKDDRNQMAQQGPRAWPTWTNTDNMHRNAFSEETE